MNKNIRLILVFAVLICFAVIAGGQGAWALPQPSASPAQAAAPYAVVSNGSVVAPGCGGKVDVDGTLKSLCGGATITGLVAANQVIGYAYLSPVPNGFISKVIHVVFYQSGSATICFAAWSNEVIYAYDQSLDKWFPVPTTISGGQACTTISENGAFVLGK